MIDSDLKWPRCESQKPKAVEILLANFRYLTKNKSLPLFDL